MEICRRFEADLKHGLGPSHRRIAFTTSRSRSGPRSCRCWWPRSCDSACARASGPRSRNTASGFPITASHRSGVRRRRRPGADRPVRRAPVPGRGEFGRVYLCRDEQLDRLVAIKVPRAEQFLRPRGLDRFLHEARLAAKIKHPGIVTVYQVARDPDRRLFRRPGVHRGPVALARSWTRNGSRPRGRPR